MNGLSGENLIKELESEYYKKLIEDFQKSVAEYGLRESFTAINWGD